ncbi:hypothetical protein NKR23_g10215 [Pleurostoma richardsiae]|uniref:Uncharacterized protein n=1 Tax=Pleurostoma richardsiae TaxID=41990 RepID=A0AA38VIH4_9PEZI|nr:hypothetical protein NKR23_g10215 [Pleurostoma richardsiae]
MVLSMLLSLGAVIGGTEGIKQAQRKSKREEHRSRKNNLIVHCPKSSQYSPYLEGRRIVLSGDKLYVDTGTEYNVPFGHTFAGYYLAYPESRFNGLVSTITDEAPIMNWIYVHKETYELKFGTRQFSEGNLTGPFDCTRQDRRLTFGGWEGFVVVKEGDFWALYFDRDGDQLRSKVAEGTPVIEVELFRKEIRVKPPPPPPEDPPQAKEGGQPAAQGVKNDAVADDAAEKEAALREAALKEAVLKEAVQKEVAEKEAALKEAMKKQASRRESFKRESVKKERARKTRSADVISKFPTYAGVKAGG